MWLFDPFPAVLARIRILCGRHGRSPPERHVSSLNSLSRFRRRSLLLAALTVSLVSAAEGQVTIKEKVEITGQTVAKASEMMETPNPAPLCLPPELPHFPFPRCNYVVPKNVGNLYMKYYVAYHVTGYPPYDQMKVTVIRDDSSWTFTYPMQTSAGPAIQYDCLDEGGLVADSYTTYNLLNESYPDVDSLDVGRVLPSDTVVVYYDYGSESMPIQTDAPDSWWPWNDPDGYPYWDDGLLMFYHKAGPWYCEGLTETRPAHLFTAYAAIYRKAQYFEVDVYNSEFLDNVGGSGDTMFVHIGSRQEDGSGAPNPPLVDISLDPTSSSHGYLLGPGGIQGASLSNVDPDSAVRYVVTDVPPTLEEGKIFVDMVGDTSISGEGSFWLTDGALVATADPNPVAFSDTSFVTVQVWDSDQPDFIPPQIDILWDGDHNGELVWMESDGGPWTILQTAGFNGFCGVPYDVVDPDAPAGPTVQRIAFISDSAAAEQSVVTNLKVRRDYRTTPLQIDILDIVLTVDVGPDYLPMADSIIGVTIRVPSKSASSPGYSVMLKVLNYDYGDGAETFTIKDDQDSVGFRVAPDGMISTYVTSHQYWGVATVIATITGPSFSELKGVADTVSFPQDVDMDGIADSWEMSNGGLAMSDSTNLCDDPIPQQVCQDGEWDEETSPGSYNNGDGLTKLAEYQGALVGSKHKYLSPKKKEVFASFDQNFDDSDVVWAIQRIETQLGVDVRRVGGYTSFSIPAVANGDPDSLLTWLGELSHQPYRNVIIVNRLGTKHDVPMGTSELLENGLFVQFGIYTVSGLFAGSQACNSSLDDCRRMSIPGVRSLFGTASPLYLGSGSRIKIWDGFTENIHQHNSIPESVNHEFKFGIVGQSGRVEPWYASYSNRDLDNSGEPPADEINPFDIMSPSRFTNDEPPDGIVAGRSEAERVRVTLLHELGHSLGMYAEKKCDGMECHPVTGDSVMRPGMGPGKSTSFTTDDIRAMRLKP